MCSGEIGQPCHCRQWIGSCNPGWECRRRGFVEAVAVRDDGGVALGATTELFVGVVAEFDGDRICGAW